MSPFQRHSELFNKPILLSQEEEKDPLIVIKKFFEDYTLSEVREIHEHSRNACLICDIAPFDDPTSRDWLILFCQEEEKILEAAFLLRTQYAPGSNP